jgi:hypothetical protein
MFKMAKKKRGKAKRRAGKHSRKASRKGKAGKIRKIIAYLRSKTRKKARKKKR